MLASWVMQAGFEPPMVSVALGKGRYMAEWLSEGHRFVLNILDTSPKRLLRHFARGFAVDEPAFVGLDFVRSSHGVPILAESLGHLECVPVHHVDSGDHRIFLAEVHDAGLVSDAEPFIHTRKNGLKY